MKELTQTEMLIRVHEWMGWQISCDGPPNYKYFGLHPSLHEADSSPVLMPPLTLDLMHEAEAVLDDRWERYEIILFDTVGAAFWTDTRKFIHATKEHRLKALYQTINQPTEITDAREGR